MSRPARQRYFECLEGRQLLSAQSLLSQTIASRSGMPAENAAEFASEQPTSPPVAAAASNDLVQKTRRDFISNTDATRWDWLAGSRWYVPVENLLAYTTPSDLSHPTPLGDQTLWFIEDSENGRITGEAVAKLSTSSSVSHMSFTGVVTQGGQIRFEFFQGNGGSPVVGIGQMRFLDGAWRMQMQMATPNDLLVTHWAYMSQWEQGSVPPDAGDPLPNSEYLSRNWSWIEGTTWAITDQSLFGSKSRTGVFTISNFDGGYFWGSGAGKEPFNVLGSVTPEGNLLFLVSVDGGDPQFRTGMLEQTSGGGLMTLRTYEGQPNIGAAWTIDLAAGVKGAVARFTGSVQEVLQIPGQSSKTLTKQVRQLTKELKQELLEHSKHLATNGKSGPPKSATALPEQSSDDSLDAITSILSRHIAKRR